MNDGMTVVRDNDQGCVESTGRSKFLIWLYRGREAPRNSGCINKEFRTGRSPRSSVAKLKGSFANPIIARARRRRGKGTGEGAPLVEMGCRGGVDRPSSEGVQLVEQGVAAG
jgi:hypothetical protein